MFFHSKLYTILYYNKLYLTGYNIQYTPASCCSKSYSNGSLPCAVNVSAPDTSPVFTQVVYIFNYINAR